MIEEERYIPKIWPFKANWSYADKTKIAKDWEAALCPDMDYDRKLFKKKRRFLVFDRQVGPLLVHVTVSFKISFSAFYSVNYYINSLCTEKELYLKTIGINVSPIPTRISYYAQEEEYPLVLKRLKKGAYIPLAGHVTLTDIFEGYKRYFDERAEKARTDKYFGYQVYTSSPEEEIAATPALVAAWAGEAQKAEEYLSWGLGIMSSREGFNKDEWLAKYKQRISNPEKLRQTVLDWTARLNEIMAVNISCVPYQGL